jgi:RNA polymerase sigma factor (sigma-70 family)
VVGQESRHITRIRINVSNSPAVTGDPYLTNRDAIERAIGAVCRRHRLSPVDGEDFASSVRLRLIENDYAVLRAFRGRSKLETYLASVVTHALQDWRNAKWGKWRPSAEARRLGPVAVRLETLLVRDQCSFDEAVEQLSTDSGFSESRAALEALAARFPRRVRRRDVGDTPLDSLPATSGSAEDAALTAAAGEVAERIASILSQSISLLDDQDRLVLRLHFEDGRTIADISRLLDLDQKTLYRRLARLLGDLRSRLEGAGLAADVAAEALERRGFDVAAFRERGMKLGSTSVFSSRRMGAVPRT